MATVNDLIKDLAAWQDRGMGDKEVYLHDGWATGRVTRSVSYLDNDGEITSIDEKLTLTGDQFGKLFQPTLHQNYSGV